MLKRDICWILTNSPRNLQVVCCTMGSGRRNGVRTLQQDQVMLLLWVVV
jgi:hypothetical protein